MADIREHYEGQGDNSFLRARSSERAADKIAVQAHFDARQAEMEAQASAQEVPAWVVKYEAIRNASKIVVARRKPEYGGSCYFMDALGCKTECPSDVIPFHEDGITLAELCAKARAQLAPTQSTPPELELVVNLTQHAATTEQVEAGVVEPADKGAVQAALTFDAIPTASEMADRAAFLARVAAASGCKRAMIGGAPFFMAPLERALIAAGVTPVYAFSARDSREEPDGNGGVRKVNVFRHVGFVEVQ